jgi:hypothetical protein
VCVLRNNIIVFNGEITKNYVKVRVLNV